MARINLIVVATILCLQLVNCQDLTKAFSHGDENQDGKLSKKELRSAMETMGIFMNKADSVHASITHDVNSDNRIDMAEFQVLAAAEQSAGLGRLCRRSLEASGALGLVEGSAHYVDLALPAAMAVSPPSYGYFTTATIVLLVIYAAGIFLGSKYEWFVKHRVYVLGAAVLSTIEYLFGDESGKKKKRNRHSQLRGKK